MKHGVHDHATLISALGGAPAIAQSPGVELAQVSVRAWVSRNRIPPEYWSAMIQLAASAGILGVTSDWLLEKLPARNRAGVLDSAHGADPSCGNTDDLPASPAVAA